MHGPAPDPRPADPVLRGRPGKLDRRAWRSLTEAPDRRATTVVGHDPSTVTLDHAIDAYLTFLAVERGLSPATTRAYRADLADYAASRGTSREWAGGPEPAIRYLAARTRRGKRHDPGLAPTSLRRRAAAIKGFYRFAF